MDYTNLIRKALEARSHSYSPYSHFAVGAALLCADGTVYQGANIENAAFGVSQCAERTALFQAVFEGKREFTAIAIVGKAEGAEPKLCAPCGICRQALTEFCSPEDFEIVLAVTEENYKIYKLAELLPLGFTNESLH
ncbi:MAG: cytidine deaminase [Blautia sp.]|nr:cytidine deaminase [Blautia sp.]